MSSPIRFVTEGRVRLFDGIDAVRAHAADLEGSIDGNNYQHARMMARLGWIILETKRLAGYQHVSHVMTDLRVAHTRGRHAVAFAEDVVDPATGELDETQYALHRDKTNQRKREQRRARHGHSPLGDDRLPGNDAHGNPSVTAMLEDMGIRRPKQANTSPDGVARDTVAFSSTQTGENVADATFSPNRGPNQGLGQGVHHVASIDAGSVPAPPGIDSALRGLAQAHAMPRPAGPARRIARIPGAGNTTDTLPFHLAETAAAVLDLARVAQRRADDGTIDTDRAIALQAQIDALHQQLQEVCA